MPGKFCVSLSHAKDNSDKATVGFVIANAAVVKLLPSGAQGFDIKLSKMRVCPLKLLGQFGLAATAEVIEKGREISAAVTERAVRSSCSLPQTLRRQHVQGLWSFWRVTLIRAALSSGQ